MAAPDSPSDSIVLVSQDGEHIEISRRGAALSETLNNAIQDTASNDDVEILDIEGGVLRKVVEFLEYHSHPDRPPSQIPQPFCPGDLDTHLSEFDKAFFNVEKPLLLELVMAAHSLSIESLLNIACAKVTDIISDKSPQRIRESFDLVDEIFPQAPQEEKQDRLLEDEPSQYPH